MKKITTICVIAIAAIITLTQYAGAYSVTLQDFEGRDTEVTLNITSTSASKVEVTAEVSSGIADIQGLFFNFTELFSAGDLKVTGDNVTQFVYSNNAVDEIKVVEQNGKKKSASTITMSGTKSTFDLGLAIGTSGIGKDDIRSTSFTIESLSGKAIALTDTFGARLTSVGADREDSRKLIGTYKPTVPPVVPPTAIPEPSTLLLIGSGIVGVAMLRKKVRR